MSLVNPRVPPSQHVPATLHLPKVLVTGQLRRGNLDTFFGGGGAQKLKEI